MTRLSRSVPALVLAGFLLSIHVHTQAQTKDFISRDVDLFVTATYLLPSDNISLSDYGVKAHQDGAIFGRFGADAYLIPKLSMGVYMCVGSVKVSAKAPFSSEGESVTMMEFGGSLKGRFIIAHGTVAIKIGGNIGYRMLTSSQERADKVDAFSVGPSLEVQFGLNSVVAPHVEIGFLSQPTGGNEYTSITFPPILYLGAGCSLGL